MTVCHLDNGSNCCNCSGSAGHPDSDLMLLPSESQEFKPVISHDFGMFMLQILGGALAGELS